MIVHVFNSSVVSGPETLVIPALPRLQEKSVVLFLSETRCGDRSAGPPAYARSHGLETLEIPVRSRWDRRAIAELSETLGKLSPRIVHAHEVKASAYVAAASPRARAYRLVTTNHGVRAKRARMLRLYEWIFTRLVMPRFDRVLCVCSSDRELLIRRGVPSDKVRVHLNGVDRPRIPPGRRAEERARARAAWGLNGDAIYLGVVGRLAPEKRHAYILRALKSLRAKIDARIIIFGTGALADELHAETRALGLEPWVHWMGYRESVGAEMAGFDLLLSLSFAEGLPINLVEAGWAGTPVFATAVDGNRDLVPSPEYGILVEPELPEAAVADALGAALSNPTALKNTGARFQKRIEEEFSGSVWIRRLEELYRF